MYQWCLILIALVSVTGCGGLQPDAAPSQEVPLSGSWVADPAASDDVGSAMRPDSKFSDRRQRMSTAAEIQRIRRGSGLAYVAHDFQVLDAKRMRIELGADSMGIQHFPGIYRDVTWGTGSEVFGRCKQDGMTMCWSLRPRPVVSASWSGINC